MYQLKFLNNEGPCIFGDTFGAALSERTDCLLIELLIAHRNDAGIIRKIGAVLSGKYFLRIIEISHLNI